MFRDHILHLKTKANGKVESMIEYSHSEIDVVFHDDMASTGFDTVSYNWFKPRYDDGDGDYSILALG